MDDNMLLNLALDIGGILLSSGAEIQRVENTMERILSVNKYNMPESFVLPTGLFAGVQGELSGSRTKFKRIPQRTINLEKIATANSISREFVEGRITIEEAFKAVEDIHNLKPFPSKITIISHGLAAASFTILFRGTIKESIISFFLGCFLGIYKKALSGYKIFDFITNFIGSMAITLFGLIVHGLGVNFNYDNAITGALMLLVPGVSITNAIRDGLQGDYISCAARITETIMIAVAIATGVGIAFSIFSTFGGVL